MNGQLEQRYRRVLRLLPPCYRRVWEEDMLTAFLESMRTGDPEDDELAAVPLLLIRRAIKATGLLDWPGPCCMVLAGASLWHLPRVWFSQAHPTSSRSLTLALLAVVTFALRVVTLGEHLHHSRLVIVGVSEAIAVLAIGLALSADAARALRRPGATPPAARARRGNGMIIRPGKREAQRAARGLPGPPGAKLTAGPAGYSCQQTP